MTKNKNYINKCCETLTVQNSCFSSKQCSTSLHDIKIGKHECIKIAAMSLLFSNYGHVTYFWPETIDASCVHQKIQDYHCLLFKAETYVAF